MKTLIVEDDFLGRAMLTALLSEYGECHVALNGEEALAATERSMDKGDPYDLICLDIMMPVMDGQRALEEIRKLEAERGIVGAAMTKVIMTTALDDSHNILRAFKQGGCEAYLTKPVDKEKLISHIKSLNLI